MSLRRKEIRNAVIELLRREVKRVKDIRPNRSTDYEIKKLPAISVYTRNDNIASKLSDAPRYYHRQLDIVIEVVVADKDDDKAADMLDEICQEIEDAMTIDDSLHGMVWDTEIGDIAFEQDSAQMKWSVKYEEYLPRTNAKRGLVPFEGADVTYQLDEDAEPEAEDTIDLPTS